VGAAVTANFALWIAMHAAIGCAGTWLARNYAIRNRLIDLPGERRSHGIPTPRGGGISIVVSMVVALAALAMINPTHSSLLLATAFGCSLVAGIGWLDDHRPLSPGPRLLVQAMAAAVLAWGLREEGAGALTVVGAALGAMVLVNVWNFMDGIDGLAASQALLVAGGYGLLAGHGITFWFAWALVAACLGFLPFNLPNARIFLGDVGSGALGYAIAALAAWTALKDDGRAIVVLFPLSAFLLDASLTLAARVLGGKRWWLPHAEHAYQHWARRVGHGRVTLAYAGWTVVASGLMLAARNVVPAFMMTLGLAICLAGAVGWACLRRPSQGQGK
jgi:UDP-N-acetylmuramyl pentapeptide phosphotransferase/UDP-N-acetylglucosamine-1-phosphate transferase